MDEQSTSNETFNERLSSNAHTATVWAYLRISSHKQMDDGAGLDTQRQAVQAYAEANNLTPLVIIDEVASAGKPMVQARLPGMPRDDVEINPRPRFMALMGVLCNPSSVKRHLIVYRLDRFARISSEQDMLLEMLSRAGVQVHSTQASEQSVLIGSDMRDPGRILFRQIMASFAQYERAIIHMRLQAGIRAKASRGCWVSGHPPFGYVLKDRDLIIDEKEAEIVRVIFFLRTQQELSMRQISATLAAEWAQPGWHASKVQRVLRTEAIYRGTYTDPYGVPHERPDYVILPNEWHTWAETNMPRRQNPLEFTS